MEGQSKKSKKTKSKSITRATSTSRNRKLKGGMSNSEIKEKIKDMIGYRTGDKNFQTANYVANYQNIYSLWSNLSDTQKEEFGREFIQVARFNPFVNHDDRIEVYKTIIEDLKESDREKERPDYMRDSLKPKSVKDEESRKMKLRNQYPNADSAKFDELYSKYYSEPISGGKSRRCRRPRRPRRRHSRSSKKYKKACKSRRANRRHSRKH